MFFRKSFALLQAKGCRKLTCNGSFKYPVASFSISLCNYISSNSVNTYQASDDKYLVRNNSSKMDGSTAEDYLIASVKNLSKEISKSDKFIKMIRLERELDERGVSNILRNFRYVRKLIICTTNIKGEIKSSKEFSKFLKALEENVWKLDPEELLIALSFYHWFYLNQDDLYVLLMVAVIEKLNDLNFEQAVYLFEMMKVINKDKKDVFKNEVIEGLTFKIEKEITEKIGKEKDLTDKDVISVLRYIGLADCTNWSDDVLIKLLNLALENSNVVQHSRIFDNCFSMIHNMKDENKMDSAREKLLKQIYDAMLQADDVDFTKSLSYFVIRYASKVFEKKEPFDKEFFDDVVKYCLRGKTNLKVLQDLVIAINLVNHPRMDVVKKITGNLSNSLLPSKFRSKYHCSLFYADSLEILSWVFDSKKMERERLHNMQTVVKTLPILNNMFLEDANLLHSIRIAVSLASMNIFSDELLDSIRKKVNEIDFENEKDSSISYYLLTLNQAVTVFNKNYPKEFLSENILSTILDDLYACEVTMPEDYKSLKDDIVRSLESVLPQASCLLTHKYTKTGHHVPWMVALNERIEYLDFKSVIENNSKYIEDISVPENYKIILLMPLLSKHYTRSEFLLKSIGKIRLNTLEAMHYTVIPILEDVWLNLPDDRIKVKFIRDIIFKKINRLKR